MLRAFLLRSHLSESPRVGYDGGTMKAYPAAFAWALFGLALAFAGSLPGQGAVSQRVRSAQNAFNAAQAKFTQAQQNLNKAQTDVTRAQSAWLAASNKVLEARSTAARQHAAEVGMAPLISERETLSHQAEARRKTVEEKLKTRSDYQAAEKEAENARQRLGELSDDKSLDDGQREKLGSGLPHPRGSRVPPETPRSVAADLRALPQKI